MIIGLVKEIKTEEYRVGLTPDTALEYIANRHSVLVEKDAGVGSGFSDQDYVNVGCEIVNKEDLFAKSEMIIKVKEPLEEEYDFFREGQILYTYLHLAANKKLTEFLLQKKIMGIAYETVTDKDGGLPLLKPMSEIAGRLAIQEGAKYLEKTMGGRGVLLGGVPGIRRGNVVILGGGIVGINACKMAIGLGANVTVLDISGKRLEYLDDIYGNRATFLYSNESNILQTIKEADLVVGAVLIPGAAAPKLIKKEYLHYMKKGSVIVDVAVDQGGCCETTVPTTHKKPIFKVFDIVHYCVANMPGSVALSSTIALTSVTNKYGLMIATMGLTGLSCCLTQKSIRDGLNTYNGMLTNISVANSLNLRYDRI
jgi:alanine dehydrogenase